MISNHGGPTLANPKNFVAAFSATGLPYGSQIYDVGQAVPTHGNAVAASMSTVFSQTEPGLGLLDKYTKEFHPVKILCNDR